MFVTITCRNDELNNELSWLFTDRFSATRYMKVKRMEITEIVRGIWLFSAHKIKSSEYFSKQPTQLTVKLNLSLRHIIVTFALLDHPMYMIRYHFGRPVMCMCVIKPKIFSLANLKRVFVFVFVARV